MLKNNPCVWFEIPCKDITKAMSFYEKSLEIKFKTEEMGPLKMATFPWTEKLEGASGALVSGPSYSPSHHGAMVYFSVDDIETTLKNVTTAGGRILNPKTNIGKYGFIAHFEDTEGNRIGIHGMK